MAESSITNRRGTVSGPGISVVIAHGACSDAGLKRTVNEDAYFAAAPVYLVADGMGGHAHGELASNAAVETFRRHIVAELPSTPEQVLDAIYTANETVHALSGSESAGAAVAGTTLAGIALVDVGDGDVGDGTGLNWMLFNIGDSRIYAWEGDELEQLSVDHSSVQELISAGLIPEEEAETHPNRNMITRAVGTTSLVEPDIWLIPIAGKQSFLICTDGLTKELDDVEIAEILGSLVNSPGEAAAELVRASCAAGGRDNITVVVVISESHSEMLA